MRYIERPRHKTSKMLKKHARKRALQRFGWELNRDELAQIVRDIQNHRATFVDRQSLTVTRWLVTVRETRVAVVYDKRLKEIRTVMPAEYIA